MSLLSSRASRLSGPSSCLCALLALLLLTPPAPLASAGPVAAVVIAAGPQCSKVEVVASLKNGKEICLDPEAPLIKKAIQKILESGNKEN